MITKLINEQSIVRFEEFTKNIPAPFKYDFKQPLILDEVLNAYYQLHKMEIDTLTLLFGRWTRDTCTLNTPFECLSIKHFEVALFLFVFISTSNYPVWIYWDNVTNDYAVEVPINKFVLCEKFGSNSLWDDEDFYVYIPPDCSEDEREDILLSIINSHYK